jgi:methionine biosynthesis protein MetW
VSASSDKERTSEVFKRGGLLGNSFTNRASSPDANAAGLSQGPLDPLRYEVPRPLDRDEVPGIMAGMIPAGSRFLDVGCGEGTLGEALSRACRAEFVGIEPDAARAARARARGLNVVVNYFGPQLVREIGPVDVVVLADVLEHLPDPQSMLLVCREALKPRGSVIVSVPNVAHWSVRAGLLQGRFRYQTTGIMDATHLRWFTAESAKSLLASAGFGVVEYRASAGVAVPDNLYRAPLCWVPTKYRTPFLRLASRNWPTLFGAQHVLKAEME